MKNDKNIEEFVDAKIDKKEQKKVSVKDWFDGSVITHDSIAKQLPYILFIAFLGVLYIGNRYQAEKIVRNLDKIQQEVKDLRAESIIVASELMMMSRQSEVYKQVKKEGLDLEESVEPPKKIKKY